jgi:hypothetical protein
MGLRFRVVLLIAVAVSGGLLATVASAASASKTSVSLQFASHTNFKGRVSSRSRGTGSCASGTSKIVTAPGGTTGGSGQPGGSGLKQPACSLPLTHDTYDGFHIAVPGGWELFTLKGQIEVEKDAVGSEAVVVCAGINRHGEGDERALHRRSSESRWPRVMRWRS